jgi:hypothetical protein
MDPYLLWDFTRGHSLAAWAPYILAEAGGM